MRWCLGLVVCVVGCAHGTTPALALRRVVLHQNGNGYFERGGRVEDGHLTLRLSPNEVNDTLATLTVLEEGDDRNRLVVSAEVPHPPRDGAAPEESVALVLHLPGKQTRMLRVAYAVPTPTWQMTYRVILPEREGGAALLQVWAMLHNASQEDWRDVQMTLATGAPLSFASNLRTPLYTSRPDVTGRMIAPVSTGPVLAERGAAVDTDHDQIPDAEDRCPNDPETYNGTDDADGCPDHGRVVVEATEIRIMQAVNFAPASAAVAPASMPVLEAVAASLRGNPQIRRIEVQGHAAADERDAWNVGMERAAAVRALLIARGVDPSRVVARSVGSTQPLDPRDVAEGRARNRRASFRVVDAGGDVGGRATGVHARFGNDTPTAPGATTTATVPQLAQAEEFMGATQYVVTAPVTLTAGSAALVTVASVDTPGDDVYLFRPDASTPGSAEHPYRAAFLRNHTGLTLVAGQAAVFAHGTFVGQGLLERLDDGQSTWIPYALDASATVAVTRETTREKVRVVSAQHDTVVLEDASVEATRYVVTNGAQGLPRVFLRWEHRAGYTPRELPPETVALRGASLVPLPLTPGHESTLTLSQAIPLRFTLSLTDDVTTDLAPYLPSLPEADRQRLRAVLERRAALADTRREIDEHREQLQDLASRNAELRETLRALPATPAQATLRAQTTRQLQEAMARYEVLSRAVAERTTRAASLRAELADATRTLQIGAAPAPAPAP